MSSIAAPAAASVLIFAVLPIWIAAGLADYFCHRITSIEKTSGTTESILHLVQFSLVGIAVAAALFLNINAGYFLGAFILLVFHHAAAAIDLVYTNPKRHVAPREQMVHSFLEIMPIAAFMLLAVLHWTQFLALLGMGTEAPAFAPKARVLPPHLILIILSAALLLNLLPYLEELWRCLAYQRRR
jgi:hypothetical protein